MSLTSRVLTTIFVIVILYTALDYGIHRFIIFPSYLELEKTEAQEDINRCLRALRREIHHLDMFVNDWAAWDDTYQFVEDRNNDYIVSNLGHQTFVDNRLNAIWICNAKGETIWGEWHEFHTGDVSPSRDIDCQRPALTRHAIADSSIAGILTTASGPLLVASRPVITSERKGVIRGTLIMGRRLTDDIVDRLVLQTQVEHRILHIDQKSLPDEAQHAIDQITPERPVFLVVRKTRLSAYATIPDLAGAPALLVRADIPRHIIAKGATTMRYAIFFNLATGFLLLAVLLALFQHIVKPIADLTRHAEAIRDTGNLSLRHTSRRRDEIGLLTREFNGMVDQLQFTQQNLQALVAAKTKELRLANQRLMKEIDVRKQAQTALHEAHNRLEEKVEFRTAELLKTNAQLSHEIEDRRQAEIELKNYQCKLRSLSSQLLLAEEGERRRIASELHDRIGQALTISKIQLDTLHESTSGSDLGDSLKKIGDLIDQIIRDMRRLTFELSPPILYEFGLAAALEWLIEQFQEQHELVITLETDFEARSADKSYRVLLFQACRELLFNIVKHARAHHVAVSIKRLEDKVEILIADDGIGFDPIKRGIDAAKNNGYGLFSIRERLHHLGGSMDITSAPGQGTCICLQVPTDGHQRKQI